MKTIRYESPQKHEVVSGAFMKPTTKDVLFEENKIDPELPISADLFYFQTNNPGFLKVAHPDVPFYSIYEHGCPADCLAFYWNMACLMRQAGMSIDIATRTFSNLNNKNTYTQFVKGRGYSLMNVRLVAEFISAFSLTKEEVAMMLAGPITTTSKPYIEKINKNRIGTKNKIAEELSKLLDQVEVNPLLDGVLDNKTTAAIRAGISGRSYMHLDEFLPLMRYCGVDPVSALFVCQSLNVHIADDGESVFCKMRSSVGQNLDAYHHSVEIDKNSDDVAMGLIIQSYLRSPNNSQDNLLCFRHNMDYIREHYEPAFKTLKDTLAEKPLSFDLILAFFAKATGIEASDIVTGMLSVFDPENGADSVQPAQQTVEANEQSVEESAVAEGPALELSSEKTSEITFEKETQEKRVCLMSEDTTENSTIKLEVKRKYSCSRFSWKNENPNKNEEGYYWGEISEQEKHALEKEIEDTPILELSICKVKSIIRKFYSDELKVFLSIYGNCVELSFGFSLNMEQK